MNQAVSLDLEDIALLRKPRPWGWFFSGIVLLGAAGFAIGFYVPLRRAHHLLAAEYEKLAKKTGEIDRALVSARASLEAEQTKVRGFERALSRAETRKEAATSGYEALVVTLEGATKSLLKAKLLTLTADDKSARASFGAEVLFPRGAKAPAPGLAKSLCELTKTVRDNPSFRLEVAIPVLAPFDETQTTLAAARLASLATHLGGTCHLSGQRLALGLAAVKPSEESPAAAATTNANPAAPAAESKLPTSGAAPSGAERIGGEAAPVVFRFVAIE